MFVARFGFHAETVNQPCQHVCDDVCGSVGVMVMCLCGSDCVMVTCLCGSDGVMVTRLCGRVCFPCRDCGPTPSTCV